mmetsp:Transcript_16208/g.32268  ORF Transcript_16208/g.32268 Transcript_16208/m.32268 type:complete len:1500 (+) Transcript_16208:212-4711(+)
MDLYSDSFEDPFDTASDLGTSTLSLIHTSPSPKGPSPGRVLPSGTCEDVPQANISPESDDDGPGDPHGDMEQGGRMAIISTEIQERASPSVFRRSIESNAAIMPVVSELNALAFDEVELETKTNSNCKRLSDFSEVTIASHDFSIASESGSDEELKKATNTHHALHKNTTIHRGGNSAQETGKVEESSVTSSNEEISGPRQEVNSAAVAPSGDGNKRFSFPNNRSKSVRVRKSDRISVTSFNEEISSPRQKVVSAAVVPSGDGRRKDLRVKSKSTGRLMGKYSIVPTNKRVSMFQLGRNPTTMNSKSYFGTYGGKSEEMQVPEDILPVDSSPFHVGDHALLLVDPYLNLNRPSWIGDFCLVNRLGFQNGKGVMMEELAPPFRYVLCQIQRISRNPEAGSLGITLEGEAPNLIHLCVRLDTIEKIEVKIVDHLCHLEEGTAGFRMAKLAAKSGHQLVSKKKNMYEAKLLASKQTEQNEKKLTGSFFSRKHSELPFSMRWSTERTKSRNFKHLTMRCYKFLQLCMLNIKLHIFYMNNGVPPYNIELKLTGNTFLWICSLWFLIADMVKFCNSKGSDTIFDVINSAVWFLLVVDLFFEILIRPFDYSKLLQSKKAYYPSTQRHIDNFHFVLEFLALALYLPEILSSWSPEPNIFLSYMSISGLYKQTLDSKNNSTPWLAIILLALVRLRLVGVMRRWRQSTINASYLKTGEELFLAKVPIETDVGSSSEENQSYDSSTNQNEQISPIDSDSNDETPKLIQSSVNINAGRYYNDDKEVTQASSIKTALLVTNSRLIIVAMLLLCTSVQIIFEIRQDVCQDMCVGKMADYLSKINVDAGRKEDDETCDFLQSSLNSLEESIQECKLKWSYFQTDMLEPYFMEGEILPKRNCSGKFEGGVFFPLLNDTANIREAAINSIERKDDTYSVRLKFNETPRLQHFILYFLILQIVLLIATLLISWRLEADTLQNVLVPLFSLLEIVSLYASNPLATVISERKKGRTSKKKGSVGSTGSSGNSSAGNSSAGSSSDDDSIVDKNETELGKVGKYETDRLINTITKITSMLRQCWGVAGASIISSTLGTTDQHVFNPVVPGRKVHAIFGFIGIGDWIFLNKTLRKDTMILVNGIANVVHSEVHRWGLNGLGQCNKNTGPSFLMVFKIGDDKEVREKKKLATQVIFENNFDMRKQKRALRSTRLQKSDNNSVLKLEDLPGINEFADRAAIGMLKAFASMQRNSTIMQFTEEFQYRLQKEGRPFHTRITFGMDAGYAMEGAVGSKYKVDATYLSPHVNMAARMMSACKQFGVTLLCSENFQTLLSPQAKKKFRHIDTCTVKGSSKKQRVFTYDALYQGVDFFLLDRGSYQSSIEARNYTPDIWKTDQDLKAMRQHIAPEFEAKFNEGLNLYLCSNWKAAIKVLKEADEMMIRGMNESGAMDGDIELVNKLLFGLDVNTAKESGTDTNTAKDVIASLRSEMGDGPSKCLIKYMNARNAKPPMGFKLDRCRALDSK